jgi:uncharacterized alkaline shock family protein YloU
MANDERLSGDVVVPASGMGDDEAALVADEVIATYIADAARDIPGIVELHGSALQELSERVRVEVPAKGVVVRRTAPGTIEADVHVRVAWGAVIPDLARQVKTQVGRRIESLLDLEVRSVTLYVDEIEPPGERE